MTAQRLAPDDQPVMRLQLFGAMAARSFTGENILPRGLKARAMLAYLALSETDVVPRKRFEQLLWSQRWEEQARASVRQCVRELSLVLNRLQPKLLSVTRDDISLARNLVWLENMSERTNEGPGPVRADVATFLESLDGIDPNFDVWIKAMCDALKSRAVALAEPVLNPLSSTRLRRLDVVPFAAFGDDPAQHHMAPAMAHELATGLARMRWFAVRLVDKRENTTRANYRVEGHIAHDMTGGRVTIRLIDQEQTDAIVWAYSETISGPLRPTFVADIAERVMGKLDPEILTIETRRAHQRPTTSQDAYELLLKALPLLHTHAFSKVSWQSAIDLLGRAIILDPGFGRAQAFLAQARVMGLAQGWLAATAAEIQTIDTLAFDAIAGDPHDSIGLALAGHIRTFLHHDFAGAKRLFERAIAANPNCGFAWGYSSWTYAYVGETVEARRRYTRVADALIATPMSGMLGYDTVISYFEKNWQRTITSAHGMLQEVPQLTNARKLLILALCQSGQVDEAMRQNAVLLAQEPNFDWPKHLRTYPFGRMADRMSAHRALASARLVEAEDDIDLERS